MAVSRVESAAHGYRREILNNLFSAGVLATISATAFGAGKVPTGPELASKEIGKLLKAYPMLTQNNAMAPEGVGVILWGCDHQVGKAIVTITITTKPGDPMPCKRKVAFE